MTNEVQNWIKKIEDAEALYAPYYELTEEIRSYYKNEKSRNKQNVFWSTIETLKPFLYFKAPKPYVEQKQVSDTKVAGIACRILAAALERNMEKFDFDSIMKYVRNDFLMLGCGIAFERYVPTFKKCAAGFEILDDEKVETVYINPQDFIADTQKVNVFEDCTWVARKVYMSADEIKEKFGKKALDGVLSDNQDSDDKAFLVYEIFDKAGERILYLTKDCPNKFLKVVKDVMKIDGFFPMPKPLYAGLANDGLIPVPDYVELKPLLDELSGVTTRMGLVMQAIKVSGCYDSAFPELASILNKEVTLVGLSDFDKLKENGGLQGIIDFAPIEQYIAALQALASRRADIMNQIYEMTGVSDIMRGASDKVETATAVAKKTNFGTLRNQDRQNDILRFITDLLKIKAEIICERFSVEKLKAFAGKDDAKKDVDLAVKMLKTDKLRHMILGLDTDVGFSYDDGQGKAMETISQIHQLIANAFNVVSSQPLLLGLYRQMLENLTASLPNARIYAPVIEKTFKKIEEDLNKPDAPAANLMLMQLEQSKQKMILDHDIKQKEVAIKEAEFALKQKEADDKVRLKEREMDLQVALKQKQMVNNGKTDCNVTTGYVKGF